MKKILLNVLFFIGIIQLIHAQPFNGPINIDPNTGNEPYELESGDLDGDGDLDLVMATYDLNASPALDFIKWYQNDGFGNFTIQATISSTITHIDGLAVANIDNQFGDDIIVSSANQSKLVYFLSDGNGGFDEEITIDAALIEPGEVVTGDINNDGHIDVLCMSYVDNKTVWYSGDGTGNFTSETDVENGTSNGPFYIDVGDFDDDNDLDVLVCYANTQSIEIFYNQFTESGTDTVSWVQDAVSVDSGSSFILEVRFADVNNDGVMDVIKLDNSSGDVAWYNKIKDGPSTENIISDESIIDRPGKVLVADLDGDNLNDVILSGALPADDTIIYFTGVANASPEAIPTLIDNQPFIVFDMSAADFNGDGDLDIASLANLNDRLDLYENERLTLSTNTLENHLISIFPNPANHTLNFKGLSADINTVQVYDVIGQLVLNSKLDGQTSINVSELQSGLYTIKLNNSSETLKFIKK